MKKDMESKIKQIEDSLVNKQTNKQINKRTSVKKQTRKETVFEASLNSKSQESIIYQCHIAWNKTVHARETTIK